MYLLGAVYNFCAAPESLYVAVTVSRPAGDHTPDMTARITTHCWSVYKLLPFHLPPPLWVPPKRPGHSSRELQQLIEQWYQ